jgi:iron complex transport system substrate-binding protein
MELSVNVNTLKRRLKSLDLRIGLDNMRRELIIIAVSLIIFALAIDSIAGQMPGSFVDDLGRNVGINGTPERIVSLSPSNTEILFALGLEDRIIGVTSYCNYPPQIDELKKSGKLTVVGGYKDPDLEKIMSLHPDLVLGSKIHSDSVIPELEKSGVSVFAVNSINLSTVLSTIRKIGEITGEETQATDLIDSLELRINEVKNEVGSLPKKRVFYVLWHDPLQTAGIDTVQNEIIEMAGGENIFHDLSGYPRIDAEAIVQKDPEVIITGAGMGEKRDATLNWARNEDCINDTEARKNGRIYQIEGDLMTRAGPRIVDGLEKLAHIIHPEAYGLAG